MRGQWFKPDPIANRVPEQCPVCRTYNNIWGIATDTHCACVDGRTFITGTLVGDPNKWTQLMYNPSIGGYVFKTTGYNSLSDFLYRAKLCPQVTTLNGQAAIELVPCPEEACIGDLTCKAYTTHESKIPQPVSQIGDLTECLDCRSLSEMAWKMNHSNKVSGEGWHVSEGTIVGNKGDKNIILELSYDKGVKVDNEELRKLLDNEGIGELYFRQFPRYFVLDSDDKKWQALLRKDNNNRIFVRSFDALTPQEWFEEAKAIIATYS